MNVHSCIGMFAELNKVCGEDENALLTCKQMYAICIGTK